MENFKETYKKMALDFIALKKKNETEINELEALIKNIEEGRINRNTNETSQKFENDEEVKKIKVKMELIKQELYINNSRLMSTENNKQLRFKRKNEHTI